MTWFLIFFISLVLFAIFLVAKKKIREWRIRRKLKAVMEHFKDEHFFQQLRHDDDDPAQE